MLKRGAILFLNNFPIKSTKCIQLDDFPLKFYIAKFHNRSKDYAFDAFDDKFVFYSERNEKPKLDQVPKQNRIFSIKPKLNPVIYDWVVALCDILLYKHATIQLQCIAPLTFFPREEKKFIQEKSFFIQCRILQWTMRWVQFFILAVFVTCSFFSPFAINGAAHYSIITHYIYDKQKKNWWWLHLNSLVMQRIYSIFLKKWFSVYVSKFILIEGLTGFRSAWCHGVMVPIGKLWITISSVLYKEVIWSSTFIGTIQPDCNKSFCLCGIKLWNA